MKIGGAQEAHMHALGGDIARDAPMIAIEARGQQQVRGRLLGAERGEYRPIIPKLLRFDAHPARGLQEAYEYAGSPRGGSTSSLRGVRPA